MRHRHMAWWAGIVVVGLAGACKQEPAPEAEAPAPTQAADEQVAGADEEPAVPSAEELPIAEDFEEEATASITDDNYAAVLDELAQAIESEFAAP